MARKQCFMVCSPSGNIARKQCFLVCSPSGNMASKQCFLAMQPEGEQTFLEILFLARKLTIGEQGHKYNKGGREEELKKWICGKPRLQCALTMGSAILLNNDLALLNRETFCQVAMNTQEA